MTQLPRCRRSDTPSTPISQERMGILNVTPVTSTPGTYRMRSSSSGEAAVRAGRAAYVLWRQLRPRNPVIADLSTAAGVGFALAGGPRHDSPGHTPSFCDGVDERPGWLWIEASYVGALTAGLCGMSMKDEPPHEKGHGCGSRIA